MIIPVLPDRRHSTDGVVNWAHKEEEETIKAEREHENDKWMDSGASLHSSYSFYVSPPSSLFSTAPYPRPYSSDIFLEYPACEGNPFDGDVYDNYEEQALMGRTASCPGPSGDEDQHEGLTTTGRHDRYGSDSSSHKKEPRVTTFNLNLTYIPPPTPRMSRASGSECTSPKSCNHEHHLISTNDYVVTIEQLKLRRERTRQKVRRIVIVVTVILTLLAVLLVTAFLALGSKLEQHEWLGTQPVSSNGSPFDDTTIQR